MARDAAGTVKEKTQQAAGKTADTLKAAVGVFSATWHSTSIPQLLSQCEEAA